MRGAALRPQRGCALRNPRARRLCGHERAVATRATPRPGPYRSAVRGAGWRVPPHREGTGRRGKALARRNLRGVVSDQAAPAGAALPSLAGQEWLRQDPRRRTAPASGQLGLAPERLWHGHHQSTVEVRTPTAGTAACPAEPALAGALWSAPD